MVTAAIGSLLFLIVIVTVIGIALHTSGRSTSFKFLAEYTPMTQEAHASKGVTYEVIQYHFKADYDSFTKAAQAELHSKGFQDVTPPDQENIRLEYEKRAYGEIKIDIRYAIIRSDPNSTYPINSWIDIDIICVGPEFHLWSYLNYLKARLF